MKTNKELADELDAEDRLRDRGYTKVRCEKCNGFGQFGSVQCWHCEGKGYRWEALVMKGKFCREGPMRTETVEQIAEAIARRFTMGGDYGIALKSAITQALRDERERAAKIADGVEEEWLTSARNMARADNLVGGLAQSTYTSYAEVAGKIAAAIRKED